MLAIFSKELVSAPEELHSSSSSSAVHKPRVPADIRNQFLSSNPQNTLSFQFGSPQPHASLSFVPSQNATTKRLFCGYDEIYCVFLGNLNNLSSLIKQYGLSSKRQSTTNEAMVVIEMYRTLRDRGPYPAHQVLKDLDGSFGFVIFDSNAASVFAALSGSDGGGVELFWGVGGDGSVVICDEKEVVKSSCGKSFAAFPRGCMFYSDGGLRSFEHPRSKMMAMPRIDSEGAMCGADFKVDDTQSFPPTMPRVGSEANWALRGPTA